MDKCNYIPVETVCYEHNITIKSVNVPDLVIKATPDDPIRIFIGRIKDKTKWGK